MNQLFIFAVAIIIALGAASALLALFAIQLRLQMIYDQLRIITEFLLKMDQEKGGHPHGNLEKDKRIRG